MTTALGRADLVRARRLLGRDGLESTARLLGLAPRPAPRTAETESLEVPVSPSQVRERQDLQFAQTKLAFRPVPFCQPMSIEVEEEAEVESTPSEPPPEPISLDRLAPSGERPASPPLRPWPRLWPALRTGLTTRLESDEVDVDRVLRALGRGEQLARVPRRKRQSWAREIVVVVDRSVSLTPFWEDQDEVCRRLVRLLGRRSVREWTLVAGPGSTPLEAAEDPAVERLTEPVAFVALGDLGLLTDRRDTVRWLEWGRALERAGHRLAALIPAPVSLWPRELVRVWQPIWWDSGPPARATSAEQRRSRVERLLGLLSAASLIEPGLAREVRRLLPPGETDASYEVDLWRHRALRGRSWVGGSLATEETDRLRTSLQQEDRDLVSAVWKAMFRWHRGFSTELSSAETQVMNALRPGVVSDEEVEQADDLLIRLLERLRLARESGEPFPERSEAWLRKLEEELPEAVWERPELGRALVGAWVWLTRSQPDADLPPGVSIRDVEPPPPPSAMPRQLVVRQEGAELVIEPAPEPAGSLPDSGGSLLTGLKARRPVIHLVSSERRGQLRFDEGWRLRAPLSTAASFEIASDLERVTLERITKPGWASAIGRDRFGLFAEVALGEARLRLRWIPPGRFLMGSPEGEPGRYEDEGPQHQVTISRGLWLGATPVTQEQWQVVMNGNPSRFKSPDRPVEQVSWEDCQRFLERANERSTGLDLRLPAEAEWEYACRAGTTTATYAGPIEILGANKAPVLHPIAWYGGNSGLDFELEEGEDSSDWPEKEFEHTRAGTHPVALKDANSWGLYDMLGNVWEWCQDWQGSYSDEELVDPTGPSSGRSRVSRGGSWAFGARLVRSAFRLWSHPGLRNDRLGFRVARGPQPGAEPGIESGPSEAAEPPARSRRRGRRRGKQTPG